MSAGAAAGASTQTTTLRVEARSSGSRNPKASRRSARSAGSDEGPIRQTAHLPAGTRPRTSLTSSHSPSGETRTSTTDAQVGPWSTQTRSSAKRSRSGDRRPNRSGVSENVRSSGLSSELVGDRQSVVEDLQRLVELVARDRQRGAAHDDVPMGHQVQPPLERALHQRRHGQRGLAGPVERHERLPRRAVLDELQAPEAAEPAHVAY